MPITELGEEQSFEKLA